MAFSLKHQSSVWISNRCITYIVKHDLNDHRPVDALIVMHESMPQTGYQIPWYIGITALQLRTELVDLLTNVVKGAW